jgi:hypothetical protein
VLDVVERQVELVRVPLGAAELAAIVGEHGLNRQVELPVERQDIVVQDRHRGFRLLADVQKAEGVGAVGVDHGVQIDPADTFE